MIVNLPFDTHMEALEADLLDVQWERYGLAAATLKEHAGLVPLGPGDIVLFDAFDPTLPEYYIVRDVVRLEPVYTWWISFHLPADIVTGQPLPADHPALQTLDQLLTEWQRDTWITRHTNFDAHVSSQSKRWVEERILTSKYVQFHDLIREPDFKLDFAVAIQNPDRGDGGGPWT